MSLFALIHLWSNSGSYACINIPYIQGQGIKIYFKCSRASNVYIAYLSYGKTAWNREDERGQSERLEPRKKVWDNIYTTWRVEVKLTKAGARRQITGRGRACQSSDSSLFEHEYTYIDCACYAGIKSEKNTTITQLLDLKIGQERLSWNLLRLIALVHWKWMKTVPNLSIFCLYLTVKDQLRDRI